MWFAGLWTNLERCARPRSDSKLITKDRTTQRFVMSAIMWRRPSVGFVMPSASGGKPPLSRARTYPRGGKDGIPWRRGTVRCEKIKATSPFLRLIEAFPAVLPIPSTSGFRLVDKPLYPLAWVQPAASYWNPATHSTYAPGFARIPSLLATR